jgi:hypothetical protein
MITLSGIVHQREHNRRYFIHHTGNKLTFIQNFPNLSHAKHQLVYFSKLDKFSTVLAPCQNKQQTAPLLSY